MLTQGTKLSNIMDMVQICAKFAWMLEERKRSWIILLLFNEQLNDFYIHNFTMCQKILLPYYEVEILSFYGMYLNSLNLEEFNIFCTELAKCTKLKKLDLTKNNLGQLNDSRLDQLLIALKSCISLHDLSFNENQFNPKQIRYIQNNLNIPNMEFYYEFPQNKHLLNNYGVRLQSKCICNNNDSNIKNTNNKIRPHLTNN